MFKHKILLLAAMVAMFSTIENSLALKIMGNVDVVVVVSSIKDNREGMKDSLKKLTEIFELGDQQARIGLIDASGPPELNTDSTKYGGIVDTFTITIPKTEDLSNYYGAFNLVYKDTIADQPTKAKVIILFAAGLPDPATKVQTEMEADRLRDMGVFIYAIIDQDVAGLKEQMEKFTGSPTRVFSASKVDFYGKAHSLFNDVSKAVLEDLCGWKSMCRFMTQDSCKHEVWQEPASDFDINPQCVDLKPESKSCTHEECMADCDRHWPFGKQCDDEGHSDCVSKLIDRKDPIDPAMTSKLVHCPLKKLCKCDVSFPPAAFAVIILGVVVIPIIGCIILYFVNGKQEQGDGADRKSKRN